MNVTPAEARAIAKEAYTYGHPMVDSYRIEHAYFVDRDNPEYKASRNQPRSLRVSLRRRTKRFRRRTLTRRTRPSVWTCARSPWC